MKKIFSLFYLLIPVMLCFGQSKKTEKADQLYNSYQYIDAIDAYLVMADNNDAYVHKQLANCYYNVYNMEEALKWYKKAVTVKQDAETYYKFSQVLKSQGMYEEANKQMDVFSSMQPNDNRAKEHLENPNYLPALTNKDKSYTVEEMVINSDKDSDFGAILSNNNILYFVSSRNDKAKKDSWTNSAYLDIYQSEQGNDNVFAEAKAVIGLNTPYHDGPITISADGKTIIFSRDGHSQGAYKKINKKRVKLAQQGLYSASLIDGKWQNIKALPINSTEYSVSHPSLTKDGKTLYFTSNMPGGFGDTDIWKVSINGDNYGQPENLGALVNTSGKEGFPFISEDNILYFASSGRQGFGGFDIFKFDINKNTASINLGKGVNTNKDDFSFSVYPSKNIGYFSSNRTGIDNIYKAIPICKLDILPVVKDNNNNMLISNATVRIVDSKNNTLATKTTAENGETTFNVLCGNQYTLIATKEGYDTATIALPQSKNNLIQTEILLKPIVKDEIITDTEIKLNTIYFEFNKSNITQQGALELDRLVAIMNDYPEMKIKVRSHTDSKGNSAYNLKLSQQRAQSTVQYLISKGVSKNRLQAEGKGDTELKIDCKSNNCSEDEHAQNRRSEFLIIKN